MQRGIGRIVLRCKGAGRKWLVNSGRARDPRVPIAPHSSRYAILVAPSHDVTGVVQFRGLDCQATALPLTDH